MIRSFARRTSLMVTVVGAVAFGAVAIAPAASAATAADDATGVDGSYSVVERDNGNGPDAFLITENGRTPIFFCDEDKPNKRHNNCQADPDAGGGRF